MRIRFAALLAVTVIGCAKPPSGTGAPPNVAQAPSASTSASEAPPAAGATCGAGKRMTLRFYDVGDGLAALVDLPDGRHVLVDTGDSPRRADCGDPCAVANRHLLERLNGDLRGAPIDFS